MLFLYSLFTKYNTLIALSLQVQTLVQPSFGGSVKTKLTDDLTKELSQQCLSPSSTEGTTIKRDDEAVALVLRTWMCPCANFTTWPGDNYYSRRYNGPTGQRLSVVVQGVMGSGAYISGQGSSTASATPVCQHAHLHLQLFSHFKTSFIPPRFYYAVPFISQSPFSVVWLWTFDF